MTTIPVIPSPSTPVTPTHLTPVIPRMPMVPSWASQPAHRFEWKKPSHLSSRHTSDLSSRHTSDLSSRGASATRDLAPASALTSPTPSFRPEQAPPSFRPERSGVEESRLRQHHRLPSLREHPWCQPGRPSRAPLRKQGTIAIVIPSEARNLAFASPPTALLAPSRTPGVTHPRPNRSIFRPGRISGPGFSLYTMIGARLAGLSTTPASVPQ